MLRQLPGGLCFAHGPYPDMRCPKWPACCSDPQKEEYFDLAARNRKRDNLLRAAALLEEINELPSSVQTIRLMAERYK
jgi:hypothetical protein